MTDQSPTTLTETASSSKSDEAIPITVSKKEQSKHENYTDTDGVEYEWNSTIGGYFPILTDKILYENQTQYDYIPQNPTEETTEQPSETQQNTIFSSWQWDDTINCYLDQYKKPWSYDYLRCKYVNEFGWFLVETPIDGKSLEAIEPETGNYYRFDESFSKWLELEPEEQTGQDTNESKENEENSKKSSKKRKSKNEWIDLDPETTVYISGLPPESITINKFETMMKKYGIIQMDPVNDRPKIKIYKDKQTGCPKGDGICTFVKKESVDLAIQLLDKFPCPLDISLTCHLEKAKFEKKSDFDPKKVKKRRKLTKREKSGLEKRKEKIFCWKETDEMTNIMEMEDKLKEKFVNLKILIFKNVFSDPKIFQTNRFLKENIKIELKKLINSSIKNSVEFENEPINTERIKKLILFDTHKSGICSVAFKNKNYASYVKKTLQNKMFIVKGAIPTELEIEYWDGETNYTIAETEEELKKREEEWENYLKGAS